MKQRSFFSIIAATVAFLLVVGIGSFYWLLSHTPLSLLNGGPTASPAAAMFVPKAAPLMASLQVNPDRLEAFRQILASPQERGKAHTEFNQIKKSLLANTGLNYDRDIQPWLGSELTLAITNPDIDRDRNNGQQVGTLLALASRNSERSRQCLELFWQKQAVAGEALVFENYKGIQLVHRPLSSQRKTSLTTAVVGDHFVLLGNHPKVVKDAINNVQVQTLNLKNAANYQQALQTLNQGRIGVVFLNLGNWDNNADADDSIVQVKPSLAMAMGLNRRGLLAQAALLGVEDASVSPSLSSPVAALQYVSAASPLVAASADLNGLWTGLSATLSGNPVLSNLVTQPIADLKENSGVELPQDIFRWVQGEYALALVPRPDRPTPDWMFIAEKSPESQAAVEHLDAIAQAQGYSKGSFSLGEQKIVAWTQLTTNPVQEKGRKNGRTVIKAEARAVYGTVGNYDVFTTSVEAMNQALNAQKTGSLGTNPNFQTSIAALPQPNNGYFYVDWQASREILERQVPLLRLLELSGKPFFDHLRSLTLTSTGGEAGVRRASIFIQLMS